ncbi:MULTISPECIES: hypothetical protein [Pseudomonas]|uniref:hypothetical protein n=1 Tax=Pseudomonas TaxID=286 RepID=UPI001EE9324B|nr:hypothetical protein [Pseudomonas putida]
MKKTNLTASQDKSLNQTLKLIEATLQSWVDDEQHFRSLSHIADELSHTLGFHSTLFLLKPNPKKSPNQGKHRAILERYAVQLGVTSKKLSYEELEQELVKAKRDIQMLEDAYKATLRSKRPIAPTESKLGTANSFFYEFEQTCFVLSKLIDHHQGGLQFISGNLYDTATITGIDELVCEAKSCQPYLDWQSNKVSALKKIERL